jgi:primosomal protein N' (replication factor Y)
MKYAEVAVNSPAAQRRSFCYSVPPQLNIEIGQAVWVPFGPRRLQGIIISFSDTPSFEETREIEGAITSSSLISSAHLELARWMSSYYLAPLFDCIAPMLPPGFERHVECFIEPACTAPVAADMDADEKRLLDWLELHKRARVREIEKEWGKKNAARMLRELLQRGLIKKTEQLSAVRIKPKTEQVLVLQPDALRGMTGRGMSTTSKQDQIVEFLRAAARPVAAADVRKQIKNTSAAVRALLQNGVIDIVEREIRRNPLERYSMEPGQAHVLTPGQEIAWREIHAALLSSEGTPLPFLLQGVTGSGKTEIYLEALSAVVAQGRTGICLVPEIALTPQTIQRFAARFGERIAVFHSDLSPGEQYDEWHRIARGECDVVIGPRSALFVPQPRLGLIVIDEEHEWTYKQTEKAPRYHARKVAIRLAELCRATVIMGSATPDVESYYLAQQQSYRLITLKERITVRGITPLPQIQLVDMRDELKSGNRGIFSRILRQNLIEVLGRRQQAILFLNRRGSASFARCLSCGYTVKCPRCLVPLHYHTAENKLICHHCSYRSMLPAACPDCGRTRISLYGAGTQKVEEEVRRLLPAARIARWDRDITVRRGVHQEIMNKLVRHDVDILIGTQMIAKGLDLPQVTLAGVVNADSGLNLPDFRAAERTFQLACQIAGRAGRGFAPGRVIIQTYTPQHYAIQAAARHDYESFYAGEIDYRSRLGYPPFSQLAGLVFSHGNAEVCGRETRRMLQLLEEQKQVQGYAGLRFIGPIPAMVPRLRGSYRWQIMLCGTALSLFLNSIKMPRGWLIDIDPVGVF